MTLELQTDEAMSPPNKPPKTAVGYEFPEDDGDETKKLAREIHDASPKKRKKLLQYISQWITPNG